jgi:hypothetical protein
MVLILARKRESLASCMQENGKQKIESISQDGRFLIGCCAMEIKTFTLIFVRFMDTEFIIRTTIASFEAKLSIIWSAGRVIFPGKNVFLAIT